MFLNELDLLEIRLNYLDPIVDYFCIVESNYTFTGQPKPLIYQENKSRFSKFHKKIKTVVVSNIPYPNPPTEHWIYSYNERYLRSFTKFPCFGTNDIMISGDVDEIPTREAVKWYQENAVINRFVCIQHWRNSFLNTVFQRADCSTPEGYWAGTILLRCGDCNDTENLRHSRNSLPRIPVDGGWHFSFQGTTDALLYKLNAYSHAAEEPLEHKDPVRLNECFNNGICWYTGNPYKIDNYLPDYVLQNRDKFQHRLINHTDH